MILLLTWLNLCFLLQDIKTELIADDTETKDNILPFEFVGMVSLIFCMIIVQQHKNSNKMGKILLK